MIQKISFLHQQSLNSTQMILKDYKYPLLEEIKSADLNLISFKYKYLEENILQKLILILIVKYPNSKNKITNGCAH